MAPDPVDEFEKTQSDTQPARVSAQHAVPVSYLPKSDRYQLGKELGRGGMGEVLSARDTHIGREVAVKRMGRRSPSEGDIERFLREARVQGRLDHPAIAPIYDLAVDDDGRPFFAMKQLSGMTLRSLIVDRSSIKSARKRTRMLRAFVEVCMAVEFAHTRGVVHRDLKPANIVVGDFHDVYVIDWGVARLIGETPDTWPDAVPPDFDAQAGNTAVTVAEGKTEAGAILGTPGYMAPEQVRGEAAVGPAADIYSLGAILFEVLAGEPLHDLSNALHSTLAGIDARPSQRTAGAQIPPELDEICVRATALEAKDRFASARALGDAVQAYLDGDRDEALRKEMAQRHLAEARAALTANYDDDRRRRAIRAAGRALALDVEAVDAAELLAKLLLEPPSTVPPAVSAELDRDNAATAKRRARSFTLVVLCAIAFLPLAVWNGVRDWLPFLIGYTALGTGFVWTQQTARQAQPRPYRIWVLAVLSAVFVMCMARAGGTWLIGPCMGGMALAIFATHPQIRQIWLLSLLFGTAVVTPLALELLDVITPHYSISDNMVHLASSLMITGVRTPIMFLLFVFGVFIVAGALARLSARNVRDSQTRLALQAWQLRQLLPEIVR